MNEDELFECLKKGEYTEQQFKENIKPIDSLVSEMVALSNG